MAITESIIHAPVALLQDAKTRRQAASRRYRETHREQVKAEKRRYRVRHREHVYAKQREYQQRYRETHRESLRAYARARRRAEYAVNPTKIRAQIAAYARAHPEKRQVKEQRRRARKYMLVHDLTVAQWQTIKAHFDHRCAYCGKKQQRLTQEHLTPLSKGGGTTLHNIVPACRSCNSKKYVGPVLKPAQPLLL